MAEAVEGRREAKKKRKRVEVEVEALSETSDRIAPVVGYFPSGYDPSSGDGDPGVRVFRNKRRSNRLELLVTPPASTVEFVGRSYAGEAAAAQLCTYALGVLDKDTGTLKIVPIAANKIFRLEPRLIKNPAEDTEHSEGLAEENLAAEKAERRISDLTSLYGTKKDRDRDKKWQSLNQQRNDASARESLERQNLDAETDIEALKDMKEDEVRNIPPYDPSADEPEKAYLLDEIIPKGERSYLLDILEDMRSGEDMASKPYPSFVFNRIHKLRDIQDEEEKEKLACILSYITHLQNFWERQYSSRHSKAMIRSKSTDHPKIPHVIYRKLLRMFLDPESQVLSTEKNELLIGYILVLTLFADSFRTDPTDIARDLKMTAQSLRPYYLQLGCKPYRVAVGQTPLLTLPTPLKFPELKKNRRRR